MEGRMGVTWRSMRRELKGSGLGAGSGWRRDEEGTPQHNTASRRYFMAVTQGCVVNHMSVQAMT
ncbi:hypothetical protein E2C01_023943 [Portunus trituberculatus]|uniref:Uncharacterized protein n=1 Tax=Portunus trituberculatus TaxID=210409 RepID=A0A5B7EBE3_PORTR|nr:hypothetical protein [Portunus trituberculatus]